MLSVHFGVRKSILRDCVDASVRHRSIFDHVSPSIPGIYERNCCKHTEKKVNINWYFIVCGALCSFFHRKTEKQMDRRHIREMNEKKMK